MPVPSEPYPTWWSPSQDVVDSSNLTKFRKFVNAKYNLDVQTYDQLHAFSVDRLEDFYESFWQWAGIRAHKPYSKVLTKSNSKPADLPRFFDDARLNLAENILFPIHPRNSTACHPNSPKEWPSPHTIAIYEYGEGLPAPEAATSSGQTAPSKAREWGRVSWGELRRRVAIISQALRSKGLRAGDCVAHVSANSANPIIVYLACLSIGVIFSALPTDAGVQAIYGRLSQVKPKVIFTDDVAYYNGRKHDILDRVADVTDQLVDQGRVAAGGLEVVCLINRRDESDEGGKRSSIKWKGKHARCSTFEDYIASAGLKHDATGNDVPKLQFESLPFNHPALIVFSSGTTGEPKSICHSAGGMLINGKKEGLLQYDVHGTTDTFLQVTTTGWIMWTLQVMQLLSGASLITYDGSPLYPSAFTIPEIISGHGKVTGFGASPRLLSEMERACKQQKIGALRDVYPMKSLRMATSTGSPLNPTNVQFFYQSLAPSHAQLVSISGGTDLAGCLVASYCLLPVRGHLIGAKCLGLDLRIVDPLTGEDCEASGEAGELVVAQPFPTQPLFFWGEESDREALHEKYMNSYYRRFTDGPAKGYWAQGDLISRHPEVKGFEIHGRSDGVLNPSGVRFGSAEIYSVVESERFSSFVLDSIVVGQRRPGRDDDERVLLFVKCRPGETLTEARKGDLAAAIRQAYSARHVPKHIFQVSDIPVTANGKKTELAVKAIVCGNTKFKPSTATANPQSLDEYRQYAEIEKVVGRSSPRDSRL